MAFSSTSTRAIALSTAGTAQGADDGLLGRVLDRLVDTGGPDQAFRTAGSHPEHRAVDLVEAELVDPEQRQAVARGRRASMVPSPRTSAKSRTRRSRRLAMRGVPRSARAISPAPSASMATPRMPAARVDDRLELVGGRSSRAGRRARSGRAAAR